MSSPGNYSVLNSVGGERYLGKENIIGSTLQLRSGGRRTTRESERENRIKGLKEWVNVKRREKGVGGTAES